jgi:predicted MPP superfamily phosphohydrolase
VRRRPLPDPTRFDVTTLIGPRPARPKLRILFDPVGGAVRNVERRASIWLNNHVWCRVPGMSRPYSRLLARHLTVVEGEIPLAGWPAAFEGVSVLLITDIHTGSFLDPEVLEEVFGRLMTLRPDLILVGGDIATGQATDLVPFTAAFRSLAAPLGVYAVLGNHDHYTRAVPELVRNIEAAGMHLLHNSSVRLERGGSAISLAGLDDLHWGRPDLDAALAGTTPPVVLLSHNPDIFFEAAVRGVPLVLSGHTHGGQIRIPGLPVLVRMSRFHLDEGTYTRNGSWLVVSRGLGATGIPLRIACPPEAVFVHLRAARPA